MSPFCVAVSNIVSVAFRSSERSNSVAIVTFGTEFISDNKNRSPNTSSKNDSNNLE